MRKWICSCGNECSNMFCGECGRKCPNEESIEKQSDVRNYENYFGETLDDDCIICFHCGALNNDDTNLSEINCCKCGEVIKDEKMIPLRAADYFYKRSPLATELNIENLLDLQTDAVFAFGRNGERQLVWKVLEISENSIKAILNSKYTQVLSILPFNEDLLPVTWARSSLRKYLNEVFYSTYFSVDERKRIISVDVPSDNNSLFGTEGGEATIDKVTILSEKEAEALPSDDYDFKFWLRTPGYCDTAEACCEKGSIDLVGVFKNQGRYRKGDRVNTRPVINISTEGLNRFNREEINAHSVIPNNIKIGDEIPLGFDPHRGAIKWDVIDIQDDKALIITKSLFRNLPFNYIDERPYMWERCSLRVWLNNDFLNTYFNDSERELIQISRNENNSVKGFDDEITEGHITDDYLFLLSEDEANRYFSSDSERCCENCRWLLRTTNNYDVKCVDFDGQIKFAGPDWYEGVRPAMWINIKKNR